MAGWTRDQLLLALNLYHQTPFGKQHSRHPPIIEPAKKIGRTPGAVNMKLNNFTYLDLSEGGKGLKGARKLDRGIWAEFHGRFGALAEASEPLLETAPPTGPTSRMAFVKQRRHQSFSEKPFLVPTKTAVVFPETLFPAYSAPVTSFPGANPKKKDSIRATVYASREPMTKHSTVS